MPDTSGLRRTQSGVGSTGSGMSSSLSGENRLVSRPPTRFAPARMSR